MCFFVFIFCCCVLGGGSRHNFVSWMKEFNFLFIYQIKWVFSYVTFKVR